MRGKLPNGLDVRIWFQYFQEGRVRRVNAYVEIGKSVYTGSSRCGRKDCFVREVGREIALKRAMQEVERSTRGYFNLDKVDRGIIWGLYWNRPKGSGVSKVTA